MLTFARRVDTQIVKGRTLAEYFDLVRLSFGSMGYALVRGNVPTTRADFVRQELSEAEALALLREWEHWPRNKPNGEHSSVWPDGRRWLREAGAA